MLHATTIHGDHTKTQEYLAGWQRAIAELANFRKRSQDQQANQASQSKEATLQPLLALADNFRAIVNHVPQDLQDNSWTQGVLHVARQLEDLFAELGVQTIEPTSGKFDPLVHEAVEQTKQKGVSPGHVVEIVQVGYRLGDRVLRPAKVKVAK